MAKDPVCGMDVDENKTDLKNEYKGKIYFFCNPSCKQTFEKNPEQYAQN
ncbi:YHS domain-containing protein [Candidatus Bathyarchaeota archaeon RBG_13_38_9]|nr:MAG: YHS domain-containing protein [Candidatus Bathyarchaeota archaeon RBG_13_38_9]